MAVESALRVEVVAPGHGDWAPALRLALTGNRASYREDEEAVRSFVAFATNRGLAVPPILIHRRNGTLVTACVALESPGATAMVFVPPAAGRADAEAATIALLRELQRRAWERSLVVLQALLEPKEKENARIVAEAGFEYLAELVYLRRPVSAGPAPVLRGESEVRPFRPDIERQFLAALEESYEDSLDCPGLTGLRTPEQVLAGHRAVGTHDPSLWLLALRGGEPAGVLLLARIPERGCVEVVYVGVGRRHRRYGVAGTLLGHGVALCRRLGESDLVLAVDSINEPARRLYARWGFEETGRRRAWMAVSPSAGRRGR